MTKKEIKDLIYRSNYNLASFRPEIRYSAVEDGVEYKNYAIWLNDRFVVDDGNEYLTFDLDGLVNDIYQKLFSKKHKIDDPKFIITNIHNITK